MNAIAQSTATPASTLAGDVKDKGGKSRHRILAKERRSSHRGSLDSRGMLADAGYSHEAPGHESAAC